MTLMCLPFKTKGNYTLPAAESKRKSDTNSETFHHTPPGSSTSRTPRPTAQREKEAEIGRRQAQWGGPAPAPGRPEDLQAPRHSKDEQSRRLIEDGLKKNDFLKNLDPPQINAVVDSMYLKHVKSNTLIIQEGDEGSHMYIAAEGRFEVIKGGKVLREISNGEVFGELALLYNAKRQASIRVLTDSKVWALDRKVFQQIMVRTGVKQREDYIRFLQSVPTFKGIHISVLAKICDLIRVEFYPTDKQIVKEGDVGNTFYIVSGGSVKVTKRNPESGVEEELQSLHRGNFFGELALLNNDRRKATITALSPGAECLVLDREPFIEFLGPLDAIRETVWEPIEEPRSQEVKEEFTHIALKDLEHISTLGVGGFGRVELVHSRREKKTFALKCLKKVHVVQQQQQQHVYNEKKVMLECKESPFVIRLYRTYKDNKYIYFLMEPCLGGDVFTMLQKHHLFQEATARFMTACVVEAFDFLHKRNIVYRDLKPENVMLDSKGYVKMIDFGFAKKVPPASKTWTFAGTPEYVAPEIILGKGHDRAVDYWELGIFMHELLVGRPPFRGSDHMKTYNMILRGIEAVHFPRQVSKVASRLIRRLCRAVATERLGYQRNGVQDIKDHDWFHGFNWSALQKGTMKAPIVPQLSGQSDTRYFDKYPRNKDIPPDEFSGWDKDF
ncbi:hypothetical protein R5R35_011989 [Gryllus longicercus]|uniref:cGMP-dependent protein kinase n=1 Tax=Gryllus longicercus TaxID=2509291 RepID=A0AAN9VTK1_9ORTH